MERGLDKVPFVFYGVAMDRASAIEHQRLPLIGHVMALFAMIGLVEGGTVERVPKPLHRAVLRILRTMESAVRRLIVAAARDIVLEPPKPRPPRTTAKPRDKAKARADGEVKEKRKRRPLFNLFDPLRRLGRRFRKKKRRGPEPRAYFFPPDPTARLTSPPEPIPSPRRRRRERIPTAFATAPAFTIACDRQPCEQFAFPRGLRVLYIAQLCDLERSIATRPLDRQPLLGLVVP
ncbi:hypothetical protein J4558_25785 [Leptolyngbya sp. 15MV]|nr:hypothetical protein J4558_25785 [Leptolyngbya sp. 15MV]